MLMYSCQSKSGFLPFKGLLSVKYVHTKSVGVQSSMRLWRRERSGGVGFLHAKDVIKIPLQYLIIIEEARSVVDNNILNM